ncbi:hypothetical protein CPB86DRAFT_803964 [Serendipita vermifera]|nr:hypothetical protein CPB86DRAFT_803964 [Serendipita vermifera]
MPPRKRVREESSSEGSEYGDDSTPVVENDLDSDALDDETPPPASQTTKRRISGGGRGKPKARDVKPSKATVKSPKKAPPTKAPGANAKKSSVSSSKKRKREESDEDDGDEDEDVEVVGRIVQAPTTGRVPPGQISQNTLDFLGKLKDKKCNDREWFKLHEPVYRQAEKEWVDFIEEFTTILNEVDDEIPHLPPKDVIHRIYRDIRFSNDKTPYKSNFCASFSRSGRKGIFAHLSPGDNFIAAGAWCPGKNELEQIRSHIQRNSSQLRAIISEPTFESLFGPAKKSKDKRQSIFGRDDELKVAPKGVPKDHPDIDLLKCRTFAVVHRLTDEQVLDPEFKQILGAIAQVAKPFVRRLNHMMTVNNFDEDEDAES